MTSCFAVLTNCGATLNATTTPGVLLPHDSDGDGLYDNSVQCSWIILARENMVIDLQLNITYIQCNYDYIRVSFTILLLL